MAVKAARLLEAIGDASDIRRLRDVRAAERTGPGASALGRELAGGSPTRVYVEDQNRVSVHVGERQIAGSTIRRKVLALLCFLLTKPDMSSTRDQVSMPFGRSSIRSDALNSLNQTVYFLRRVLEEDYVDDLSPGYLHHDSDLIWLDSRARYESEQRLPRLDQVTCRRRPTPDQVDALGRDVPRAVRARLRVRGLGGSVPRLAPRFVPRDRRASRDETSRPGTSTAGSASPGGSSTSIQARSTSRFRCSGSTGLAAPMPPRPSSTRTTRA